MTLTFDPKIYTGRCLPFIVFHLCMKYMYQVCAHSFLVFELSCYNKVCQNMSVWPWSSFHCPLKALPLVWSMKSLGWKLFEFSPNNKVWTDSDWQGVLRVVPAGQGWEEADITIQKYSDQVRNVSQSCIWTWTKSRRGRQEGWEFYWPDQTFTGPLIKS